MKDIILSVLASAVAVGGPLLWLWYQERVKNLAREASDRALQTHQHAYERDLAAIQAAHQRQLAGFSLFVQKRHEVYGALYKRVRMASDQFGRMLWLSEMPDFTKYSLVDAEEYCERHKVPRSALREVS